MSAFGRGRGIMPNKNTVPQLHGNTRNGFNSNFTNNQPIVKPKVLPVTPVVSNTSNSSGDPNLHEFGEVLLSLNEEDSLFPAILEVINNPNCSEEIVKRMVQIIIDRCMWLPMITRKFSSLLPFLTSHKDFGKIIKWSTFNTLQGFYEDRESLNKYGDSALRNVIILTGEMYYRCRVGNSGYKVLGLAVLNYLKTLVNSLNEEDLLILAQQLCWTSKELTEIDYSSMSQLMCTIRVNLVIHASAYTKTAKWYLLLCLELSYQPYDHFPEDLKKFYSDNLSSKALITIKPPSLELDNHLEYYNSIRKFFS